MPALITLFAGSWKPIALALLLLGAFAYRAVLVHERDSARGDLASATAQLAATRAAVVQCQSAVAQQNAAVERLRSDSASLAQAAATREADLAAEAARTAAVENAHARELANSTIAPGCDSAIKWTNAEAVGLGKW